MSVGRRPLGLRWISLGLALPLVGGAISASAHAAKPDPVPFAKADFSGYATGTFLHADAVDSGTVRLVNADEAFSGASVDSKGLNTRLVNDLGIIVQPKLPFGALKGDKSYARGSGLEASLGGAVPGDEPTIPVNKVAVSAPKTSNDQKEVGPVDVPPLAFASVLRGQAGANWTGNCIIGAPISQGEGYAANAQLLGGESSDQGLSNPAVATGSGNNNGVTDSVSTTAMSVPVDNNDKAIDTGGLGLTSQTEQILAPVTLLKGTPLETTIKVGGVWRLAAQAGGVPGSAHVIYAPVGDRKPSAPVVTVTQGTTKLIVRLQDILGDSGLTIPVPGIATITVGTKPHAIGDPSKPAVESADGRTASGAVDIVRVTLLGSTDTSSHITQLSIGHMEARASVPAGGISCPVDMAKVANPNPVRAGHPFTYTITAHNTVCVTGLEHVRVEDLITADQGVKWQVKGTNPTADTVTHDRIVWNDIGTIAYGKSKSVQITVLVSADSGGGFFHDTANARGSCGVGKATGEEHTVALTGRIRVDIPQVIKNLPKTGGGLLGHGWALGVMALAAAGFAVRRRLV